MAILLKLKILLSVFVFFLFLSAFGSAEAATLGRPANSLGLIGYWTFDEGTSTIAGDFSGRGNTGSISGTPNWVTGKHGAALDFVTANSNGVNLGTPASLDITSSFTISAWIKPRSGGGSNFGRIFDKTDAGSTGLRFFVDNSSVTNGIGLTTNGSGGVGSSANALTLNQWQHVVVTYTTGTNAVVLYVNGVNVGSGSVTAPASSAAVTGYIGRRASDTTRNFDGAIDDVRIYSRALTAAQIAALYKSGAGKINSQQGSTVTNGLVGRWTFDGKDVNWTSATAGSAYDASGNNNIGTLTNMNRATAAITGKIGQALKFFGANNYVNIATTGWLNTQGAFSFWVYPTVSTSGGINYILCHHSGSGSGCGNGNRIYARVDSGNLVIGLGATGNIATSQTAPLNTWTHFTVNYNAGNYEVFKNGVSANTGSYTNTLTIQANAAIGADNTEPSTSAFNGLIDEFRVYNRVLTAAEAKTIYNEGAINKLNASSATLGSNGTLSQGLVGYWTFDGADVTTLVADRSGQGNNGYYISSIANTATSSAKMAGKLGQAFNFINVDNTAVQLGTPSSLNLTDAFTIAAWIKPRDFGGSSRGRIYYKGDGLAGYGLLLNDFDVNDGFSVGVNTFVAPAVVDSNPDVITLNTWQHVVATRDSSGTVAMYVNGVSAGSGTLAAPGDNSSFVGYIGRRSFDTARNFEGLIDDVRIYNRALSATEVKALYNIGK